MLFSTACEEPLTSHCSACFVRPHFPNGHMSLSSGAVQRSFSSEDGMSLPFALLCHEGVRFCSIMTAWGTILRFFTRSWSTGVVPVMAVRVPSRNSTEVFYGAVTPASNTNYCASTTRERTLVGSLGTSWQNEKSSASCLTPHTIQSPILFMKLELMSSHELPIGRKNVNGVNEIASCSPFRSSYYCPRVFLRRNSGGYVRD